MWKYTAAGVVLDLGLIGVYANTATVTVTGGNSDSDLSHYVNPPPRVDIEKTSDERRVANDTSPHFENKDGTNDTGVAILTPAQAAAWNYTVTNTGVA